MATEFTRAPVPNTRNGVEGDIAESDPQEPDALQPTFSSVVDYEAKHRIDRALRQLATHFETIFNKDESYVHHSKDLSKRVSTLILKEEYLEAHQVLSEAIDSCNNDAFDKQYAEFFSEIISVLTTVKGAAALNSALKDQKITTQTVDRKSNSEISGGPDSPNLKVWKHRLSVSTTVPPPVQTPNSAITSTEAPSKANALGSTLSPNLSVSTDSRSPTSPGHSLWFTKTIGISDSGDAYLGDHANSLPMEELITWKLFKRVSQADAKMAHDVYISFAQRLSDCHEIDKAILVVQASPQTSWNLETYKLLIYLFLSKRPKDVDGAQKLLAQYGSSSLLVNSKQSDGTAVSEMRAPSLAERHLLWFYFTSLVKEAKWSDCAERYEEAKANADDRGHAYLDNAIMAVALTYRQFEYGWKVYESIKEIDRHSPAIVMSLCWKAFFAKNPDTGELANTKDQLMTWEARAWAIYGRLQQSPDSIKNGSLRYVRNRLRDIVNQSPMVDAREAKLAQIHA